MIKKTKTGSRNHPFRERLHLALIHIAATIDAFVYLGTLSLFASELYHEMLFPSAKLSKWLDPDDGR